jgi:hypothetical protein
MTAFFSNPTVLKVGRYAAAYLLLTVFVLSGLLITESVRSNLLDVFTYFKVDSDFAYIVYGWGSYVLYLPYVLMIAVLEAYFNTAAKTGQVLRRTLKVALIEGGLGLTSVLITLLFAYLRQLPA